MSLKYVSGLRSTGYQLIVTAVIFPEEVTHSEMGQVVFGNSVYRDGEVFERPILGAGFIAIEKDELGNEIFTPYGKSTSLKLGAWEYDEELLKSLRGVAPGERNPAYHLVEKATVHLLKLKEESA